VSLGKAEGLAVMAKYANKYPKFIREFQYINKTEQKIKGFDFFRGNSTGSPAKASKDGVIHLDVSFLENPPNDYDDNRFVVVLYHELGHLYYFTNNTNDNNREDNEKFAFEFSLRRTKNLALFGDCQPLKTGLKFMQQRSLSNDLQDEHVRALKRMMNSPMIKSYLSFVEQNCR
jgi:hypothetical protein